MQKLATCLPVLAAAPVCRYHLTVATSTCPGYSMIDDHCDSGIMSFKAAVEWEEKVTETPRLWCREQLHKDLFF